MQFFVLLYLGTVFVCQLAGWVFKRRTLPVRMARVLALALTGLGPVMMMIVARLTERDSEGIVLAAFCIGMVALSLPCWLATATLRALNPPGGTPPGPGLSPE